MNVMEQLERIQFNARHRHEGTEEATASIVSLVKSIEEGGLPEEQKVSYALFALTHMAVLVGNLVSAMNETASAVQAMSVLAHENFRLDQQAMEEQAKASVKQERDYFGKGKKN